MLAKNIGSCQIKKARSGGFYLIRLICVGIIVVILTVTGCGAPKSPEPEPEIDEIIPDEIEEIESIEPEVVEAIVTVQPGSTLAIRKSAGIKDKPEDDVLDRVPEGRVFKIINKHDDSLFVDGYIWWEVQDTVSGIKGWSAAQFLSE